MKGKRLLSMIIALALLFGAHGTDVVYAGTMSAPQPEDVALTPANDEDDEHHDDENDENTENEITPPGASETVSKASVSLVNVSYDEGKHQVKIDWDCVDTASVDILMNDIHLVTGFSGLEYIFTYQLQPGASYEVEVVPYDENHHAGESGTDRIEHGDFEAPEPPVLMRSSEPITNENGDYTGFYRPVIEVSFEAQEGARYEIYRATKDKKNAYNWIANVKADKNGMLVYRDNTVGTGKYYYRVLQKIVGDDYVFQELYTALSDPGKISIQVPKARVHADLIASNRIQLLMEADSDIISGYAIYRKEGSGKYKKIATVAENVYDDTNIVFNKKYSYKVRAYYYNPITGKQTFGVYSPVDSVYNTVGTFCVTAKALANHHVKLSWTEAANAEGYEIYCRSNTKGDSYELLKTTKALGFRTKLADNKTYSFVIRAFCGSEGTKMHYAIADATVEFGFARPQNLRVSNTSYTYDAAAGILLQRSKLSWDRVFGADGYYIERYNDQTEEFEQIAVIERNSTVSRAVSDQVNTGLTTVQYRVTAYKGRRKLESEPVVILPKLGQPGKVKIKSSGSRVKISWSRVTAAEQYLVYRSNGRNVVLVGQTDKTTLTDRGMDIGVSYTYYVQAVSHTLNIESDYSEPVNYQLRRPRVTEFEARNFAAGQVKLSWNSVSHASSYVIYCATKKNGTYQKIAEVKAGTTKYTHKKLTKGTTCYYRIAALQRNRIGIVLESKISSATATVKK